MCPPFFSKLSRFFPAVLCVLSLVAGPVAAETLHVYTWADYISPEAVEKFEAKHGCSVVIDTFDSNEAMFAKLKAGATGYDIVFPTSYMIKAMEAEGMLLDLDEGALPNRKHVDAAVLEKIHDRSMRRSVPYTIGYGILACRKDKITSAPFSWQALELPAVKGRSTLLDDMRESLAAALKSLGFSINTRNETELAKAQEVLLRWKANIAKFDNEGYKAGLDSGEFLLVHGYSGDLFQLLQENSKIGIIVPAEGVTMSCDEMVILKAAPQPALAHAFINHLLDPEVAAQNMEWTGYLCPNTEAVKLASPEFLQNPAVAIPDEVKARSEVIQDVGADLAKYTRVWDAVKR
ncbi:MAG TPA: spermidine/putrescine ABC transporter substrate-binding protein [Prosthecobacter sp.]